MTLVISSRDRWFRMSGMRVLLRVVYEGMNISITKVKTRQYLKDFFIVSLLCIQPIIVFENVFEFSSTILVTKKQQNVVPALFYKNKPLTHYDQELSFMQLGPRQCFVWLEGELFKITQQNWDEKESFLRKILHLVQIKWRHRKMYWK